MTQHVTYLNVKALGSGKDRIVEGWASTPRKDRIGDVVVPEGARYELPLPLLFAHKHDEPIGSVISATVTRAGIRIRARLTEGVARAEEVWKLIKDGALTAVSIGFQPIKSTPLPSGGLRFDEWDWHELSVVSVPAQPEAKIAIGKSVAYAADPQAVRVTPPSEPAPKPLTPSSASQALTKAQARQVRLMVGEYVSGENLVEFGKGIGKVIREAIDPLAERLERIESSALHDGGIYTEGQQYRRGAVVVNDGKTWVATKDTEATPERGAHGWRLLARRTA